MPFLPPNQQRQSTEGTSTEGTNSISVTDKTTQTNTAVSVDADSKQDPSTLSENHT